MHGINNGDQLLDQYFHHLAGCWPADNGYIEGPSCTPSLVELPTINYQLLITKDAEAVLSNGEYSLSSRFRSVDNKTFDSDPSLLMKLSTSLLQYVLTRCLGFQDSDLQALVEIGIAHFQTDSAASIVIDEPVVLLAAERFLGTQHHLTLSTFLHTQFDMGSNPSVKGSFLETIEAYQFFDLFTSNNDNRGLVLSDIFLYKGAKPTWGDQRAQLVGVVAKPAGGYTCIPFQKDVHTSAVLGFKSNHPDTTWSYWQNPNGILFLFPDNYMGPDVIFMLWRQDDINLPVFVQSKLTKNDVLLKDALLRLDPRLFFLKKVSPFNLKIFGSLTIFPIYRGGHQQNKNPSRITLLMLSLFEPTSRPFLAIWMTSEMSSLY
jgi:hypothetical protein